jgi:hypothetical protein
MVIEKDWGLLRAAIPDLQDYLFSAQLYWPLNIKIQDHPQESASLTPGNLLLTVRRLSAVSLSQTLGLELERLVNEFDNIRDRWRANWQLKASIEFPGRLKLWSSYVRDRVTDTEKSKLEYSHEVRWRAILQLLSGEIGEISQADVDLLGNLDQVLRAQTISGPFIWETEIGKGFAKDNYWFLYVSFS